MSQTPETRLANQIKLWCGEHNWIIIRQQSGTFYTHGMIPFKIGFVGLSDYLIITEKGETIFVETKVHPNKPTPEQLNFIKIMNERNVKAFVCYSLDDFIKKVSE